MPIREQFPEAGSDYLGGVSDGKVYSLLFTGVRLETTYQMIRDFLAQEGYALIPLPPDVQALLHFKDPKDANSHFLLFAQNGYWHFPIKILFEKPSRRGKVLRLELYNEEIDNALMNFYDF